MTDLFCPEDALSGLGCKDSILSNDKFRFALFSGDCSCNMDETLSGFGDSLYRGC